MDTTQYHPKTVEARAQADWAKRRAFEVKEDSSKEKFYCLSMLPYPSGHLHMGHVRNYTIGDSIARYQRMLGKNVLQPMGWDAFGLPAENAAIKHGSSPKTWTYQNIAEMKKQLLSLGLAFDWTRELATCGPEYYRFEQWFFNQLYRKGIVYRKSSIVNWDPVDQTVLANEQVIDGRGWRSGALVEKKEIPQWFLKITAYADELLDDLDRLTGWPEEVKTMQRNWIGRSEGLEIQFNVVDHHPIRVFTTRPDTLMGVTFLSISPEHPLATEAAQHNPALHDFIQDCRRGSTMEADLATAEKKGLDTGLKAVHPISGKTLPIWVANFVLMEYGTGAVMAVPAHDERDFEFAQKYSLPVVQVITPKPGDEIDLSQSAYLEKNTLCHSGEPYDGLSFKESFEAFYKALSAQNKAWRRVNYRLRDWGVSRQRYWGCPIPIVYCDHCGAVPVKDEHLPVLLPDVDKIEGRGSPLTHMPEFVNTSCPECGKPARRETDTFDTFMESSWYYARYCCADNSSKMLDERANYWLPVDQYVGGIEHAVMHLLYARFFHKLMRDAGLVHSNEPFTNLLTQGMVLKDGSKMSKSKGNTVDPTHLIETFGADTARLFMMFAAPPEHSLEWSDSGVEGAHRFIKKLWQYALKHPTQSNPPPALDSKARAELHRHLKQINQDMERKQFNTIVSGCMKILNLLTDAPDTDTGLHQEGVSILLRVLSPMIPHVTSVLWQDLKLGEDITIAPWPSADETLLANQDFTIAVQVNGKLRGTLTIERSATQEDVLEKAKQEESIARHFIDAPLKKVIYVPGRLLNLVVG
ncbi:MAG: leucine--tRNA ligase [Gammaproteobacteria bacterium]|nr:leucine--tRNA ligase [Gammaproteobacteria bacterium]